MTKKINNKRKYENYKNDIDYVELDSNTKDNIVSIKIPLIIIKILLVIQTHLL